MRKSQNRLFPQEASADRILWGGKVITVDPRKPEAEAVAIKNGRFLMVGSNSEVGAVSGRKTERIALKGRTVTPGFIDSHQHLFEYGTNLLQLDCSPRKCRSIEGLKAVVLKETRRKEPGNWIRGVGYDDTKMTDLRPLNRRDLDEVAPRHPVFIQQVSGHWAVVNSRALEAGGVTEETPDPKGGSYGRDPQTGRLNGILYEQAEFALSPLLSQQQSSFYRFSQSYFIGQDSTFRERTAESKKGCLHLMRIKINLGISQYRGQLLNTI